MDNTHYRKLESFYLNANLNKEIFHHTEIEISEQKATIKMPITPKYYHALGAIHGFTYFKMLDDAAFFAAQSIEPNIMILTKSFQINFTKPVTKGILTSIGLVRSASGEAIQAESTLYNESEDVVAFGQGSFVRGKNYLKESPEYK